MNKFFSACIQALLSVMLLSSVCFASGNIEVFNKYKSDNFVAVGVNMSLEIQQAIDAGFPKIHGLELKSYYAQTKQKFQGNPAVMIHKISSVKSLGRIVKDIQGSITFWLDGEYHQKGRMYGTKFDAVMRGLDQIATLPLKNHTIIIDDVRKIGNSEFDVVALNDIILRLQKINRDYCIDFENGDFENDIMVAYIDNEL